MYVCILVLGCFYPVLIPTPSAESTDGIDDTDNNKHS